MKNVIKCPATKSKRGICVCDIKCTSSYDVDGNRIPVRKSLPYMGIARRHQIDIDSLTHQMTQNRKEYIIVTIYKDHPTFVRRIDRYGENGETTSSFKLTA